jgi:hypothetical protein
VSDPHGPCRPLAAPRAAPVAAPECRPTTLPLLSHADLDPPTLPIPRRSTYGLVDVECTKCLEHSNTTVAGSTSQSSCLVEAGYGWGDGQVLPCR